MFGRRAPVLERSGARDTASASEIMSSVVAETGQQIERIEPRLDGTRLVRPSDTADPAVIAGWWLHNERLGKEVSIAEVAMATRIEPAHLSALEAGRLDLQSG